MDSEKCRESMTSMDFFKIMFDKVLPNKLELPEKFVSVNGSTLPKSVTLKTPCGSEWTMSVLKTNGKMWLHNGSLDFANNFSITFGDLIFFRYKHNSIFKVSICDTSTCQINYSKRSPEHEEDSLPPPVSEWKNRGSGSKLHNPLFNVTVHKSMVSKRYSFHLPINFWTNHLHGKTGDVILQDSTGNTWTIDICVRESDPPRPFFDKKDWADFVHDNKLAVDDICMFELIDEVLFKVSISRATDASHTVIESRHESLMKLNSGNHSGSKRGMGRPKKDKATVSEHDLGSKKHRQRPMKDTKASISEHDMGSEQCGQKPRWDFKYTKAFVDAKKFTSRNPFFSGVIANGRNYHLRVLNKFGERYFKEKNQSLTLQAGGRSWVVRLVISRSGYYLSGGFSKFVEESSLLPGDVCVYELIKLNSVVLRVYFFRNKG